MPVYGAETLGDLLSTDVWGFVDVNRGVCLGRSLGEALERPWRGPEEALEWP
jgi:hypothetical protein